MPYHLARYVRMSNSINNCLFCGEPIIAGDKRKKFCSLSHSASYQNSKSPKRKVESSSPCKECGVPISFKKKPKGGFYQRDYCGACLRLRRIYQITSASSPDDLFENQTKGSLYARTKNWQSANSALRKHARQIYLASDKPKVCFCGYEKHIEVCHIKAVKDFSDDTKVLEINSIDNLKALCCNHHWEFDNGMLKILS